MLVKEKNLIIVDFLYQTGLSVTTENIFNESDAIGTSLTNTRRCSTTNEIIPEHTAYFS